MAASWPPSNALTPSTIASAIPLRVYGDTAVITGRGISGCLYLGEPFRFVERTSSVFVKQDDQWKCVLAHLSLIGEQ